MESSRLPISLWTFGLASAAAFAALLALEVATEEGGVSPLELLLEVLELALTVVIAGGLTLLVGSLRAQHEEKMALIRDLAAARVEGEGWRRQVQSHLDGLGAAIERQLQDWRCTDAESEVALLMLKGFSHKEIGALRGTSEATVRQQARSVYQKSGMNGRAAFCAYFLEDLLPSGSFAPDALVARPSREG
jgi:DNA-binding CsgD family transcriptional regulator